MNAQLISTINGALLIAIGFIAWRCGRISTSTSAKALAVPAFVALSILGVASIMLPVLESFRK